jgi:hypothetical protein
MLAPFVRLVDAVAPGRFLTLLLVGVLRGDFAPAVTPFVACFRALAPLAALSIFSLAFVDGRLNVEDDAGETFGFDGEFPVVWGDFFLGRIAVFTFVLAVLTLGSLTLLLGLVSLAFAWLLDLEPSGFLIVVLETLLCTFIVLVFLELADLEIAARAFDTTFLTCFVMDFGARTFRFLLSRDEELSSTVRLLRFVPMTLVVVVFFEVEEFFWLRIFDSLDR